VVLVESTKKNRPVEVIGRGEAGCTGTDCEVTVTLSEKDYKRFRRSCNSESLVIVVPMGLFAVDRGALPGQWVHAARRAALVSRIRAR
jgi:hypothetical protein